MSLSLSCPTQFVPLKRVERGITPSCSERSDWEPEFSPHEVARTPDSLVNEFQQQISADERVRTPGSVVAESQRPSPRGNEDFSRDWKLVRGFNPLGASTDRHTARPRSGRALPVSPSFVTVKGSATALAVKAERTFPIPARSSPEAHSPPLPISRGSRPDGASYRTPDTETSTDRRWRNVSGLQRPNSSPQANPPPAPRHAGPTPHGSRSQRPS